MTSEEMIEVLNNILEEEVYGEIPLKFHIKGEALTHALDLLKAESEGRLVEIPFKEGDTAYITLGHFGKRIVEPVIVDSVFVSSGTAGVIKVYFKSGIAIYGISAFKTREEAAEKLEGMK